MKQIRFEMIAGLCPPFIVPSLSKNISEPFSSGQTKMIWRIFIDFRAIFIDISMGARAEINKKHPEINENAPNQ